MGFLTTIGRTSVQHHAVIGYVAIAEPYKDINAIALKSEYRCHGYPEMLLLPIVQHATVSSPIDKYALGPRSIA
jgi:ribosomal protein S18 acetylase RimI-like enzyme